MRQTTAKRLYLGIAEDDGVSMAILGDDQGNVIGRQLGRSFDYHRLGISAARYNLSKLVRSIPGIRETDRLHTVTLAMQPQYVYKFDKVMDLVNSVVYATNVRVHCFSEAAMRGMPGRSPEIMILTDTMGSVLGRDPTGTITRLVGGGGAMDIVNDALSRITREPCAYGVKELRDCLVGWWERPCRSRAHFVARAINELAEAGNPVALEVILRGANALIKGAVAMINQLGNTSPLIGLCGCVALGSQIAQKRFCEVVGLLYPRARIEPADHAPAKGAYLSSLVSSPISNWS
ncbi:MAG TPA: hypothetical protein GX008_00105 [Firmicutes bacterium]|jgi:N-acetylglucosamine kinase-like BadF-type ATPase|nr:MAG: hypothetical protein AA931_11350 [Peptococcaceae bacterium 1109]HHT72099.1 hypothetical protein [Bacillota bacterium]